MENLIPHAQEINRPCVVCGCTENIHLFHQTFTDLSDNGSLLSNYDVVVCKKCGFCFADNIPSQSVFDSYYRDMSKYENNRLNGQDSIFDKARFRAMANVIQKFIPSPYSRIFEIGCANGQLLSLLREQGYENVSGIDPSPRSVEIAWDLHGINTAVHSIYDMPIINSTVDFAILIGVLEHLREVPLALSRIREQLTDGGLLFLSVPDASRFFEGEDAPFQEFSLEHINYFGPTSLENLLTDNGFIKRSIIKDTVISNIRTRTPVLHGLFQKRTISQEPSIVHDTETINGLKKYIDQSTQVNRTIQKKIEKIADTGMPIIIWGTGAHTLRLLATSRLNQVNIRAFVDSNSKYQGKRINDIPIISPDELSNYSEPILISTRVYQEEIEEQIRRELKLENEVIKLY